MTRLGPKVTGRLNISIAGSPKLPRNYGGQHRNRRLKIKLVLFDGPQVLPQILARKGPRARSGAHPSLAYSMSVLVHTELPNHRFTTPSKSVYRPLHSSYGLTTFPFRSQSPIVEPRKLNVVQGGFHFRVTLTDCATLPE